MTPERLLTHLSHVIYGWHDSSESLIHTWHDLSESSAFDMPERHLKHLRFGLATIGRRLKIISLFCKEPYKRDYSLQKRPIILRSLLIVASPYLDLQVPFSHIRRRSRLFMSLSAMWDLNNLRFFKSLSGIWEVSMSHVTHVTFVCASPHQIRKLDVGMWRNRRMWYDSFKCDMTQVTWLIYVWCDSTIGCGNVTESSYMIWLI